MTAEITLELPTETVGENMLSKENYDLIVNRLSKQSVDKHFEAYIDVPWDEEGMEIDVNDERLECWKIDPVRYSKWYQNQTVEVRRRIALARIASIMRTGWEFENLLQRGLLAHAFRLPNQSSEFRYIHHEVIEESHHSMMFQEFVNRSNIDVAGMPKYLKWLAEKVVLPIQGFAPQLFFFFVLGGEDPIDYMQRQQLKENAGHPIVNRIMKIHVTEEARHISFARNSLRHDVPRMNKVEKFVLSILVPILMAIMVRLMVFPSFKFIRDNKIPFSVYREIIRSDEANDLIRDATAKPRKLARELGLMNKASEGLWKLGKMYDKKD